MNRLPIGLLLFFVAISGVSFNFNKSLSSEQILHLANIDREKHGLSTLAFSKTLASAAYLKAVDMLNKGYFAHTSPDGVNPWHWFRISGYRYTYAGENLAAGFDNASELEQSWMSSDTHRANILSPFYSDVGLAVVQQGKQTIVVEFFGSRDNKLTLRQ